MAMYLLHIAIPGRNQDWTIGSHVSRLEKSSLHPTFVVLPLSAFLWGGFYLFGERFIQVLYWGFMCIAALAIVCCVIVIVGTLLGFK